MKKKFITVSMDKRRFRDAFLKSYDSKRSPLRSPVENIVFNSGDPDSFNSYLGQDRLKRRIQLRINAMEKGDSLKLLLSAPAGLGKTSLARVIAKEMSLLGLIENYYETVASKFSSKLDVDEFIGAVAPHSMVFIDEIHGLGSDARDALLPAIQDNLYAFDGEMSMSKLPAGLSWVGATTDVGKVHAALQRRLLVSALDPMTEEERRLLAIVQPVPVSADAASIIAHYTSTPWEVKDEVYPVARDISFEKGITTIGPNEVEEALDVIGIDGFGLKERERTVIRALFRAKKKKRDGVHYILSARALVASSGIDMPTYYDYIEPKLLYMGLIVVSSSGRELTDRGVYIAESYEQPAPDPEL